MRRFLQPVHELVSRQMGALEESGMAICGHSGLSIPECACSRCIERQLEQFAPQMLTVRRVRHDPLQLRDVRSTSPLPPVFERLTRPAL
jgi:hypothetical protein